MPGEPQTVTFDYKNIGSGVQDIWITFPNNAALHALNNLGRYGYLKITDSSSGVIFESSNLNDGRTRPLTDPNPNSCGVYPVGFGPTPPLCWPLPAQKLVRNNLAVGAEGTVSITFAYSNLFTGTGLMPDGSQVLWNQYPVPATYGTDLNGGSGNGLPYNVVATQVGQTP
jgi:hypothetical protein